VSTDVDLSPDVESERRFAAADRTVRFWWLTGFLILVLAAWLIRTATG
jgi:hypothetical protein